MTYFWRFFVSVFIALLLSFSTFKADALPLLITQVTARDFFYLGVNQMEVGKYEEAIENFNQAIQLQDDYAVAYNNRCLAYLHVQDYQKAIADCTQAINFLPNNIEPYLNRGIAQYRQAHYLVAIADFNQAIALKPFDFRAYYNRGVALAGAGDYTEAITNFNRALTQAPSTPLLILTNIYNDRGLARLKLLRLDAAMLDFNLAIRLNPQDYRAYFNRACTHGKNGDDLSAVRDFSEAIKLNPSNALAYVNRGLARYRLGYYQNAIADLKTASKYFGHQGEKVAYEKTLHLLQSVQQQLKFVTEIA